MLKVFANSKFCGIVERHSSSGMAFTSDHYTQESVSLVMPASVRHWKTDYGLLPIFDMHMPEGYLRAKLIHKFSKTIGKCDDVTLFDILHPSLFGRLNYRREADLDKKQLPSFSIRDILKNRNSEDLFDYLMETFCEHSGISGVMPKIMVNDADFFSNGKTSVKSATHIVKFWKTTDFPHLASNEFFCMEVMRKIGLKVPQFFLSDDNSAFVVERFDLMDDGTYTGFEDFATLNGVTSSKKYLGGYETKLFRTFGALPASRQDMISLFTGFLCNITLRNGDAHLKNFGVVYSDMSNVSLAPFFDVVTTTPYIKTDCMALTVNGRNSWPTFKQMVDIAQERCMLSLDETKTIAQSVADIISDEIPIMLSHFRELNDQIGEKIAFAWQDGIANSLDMNKNYVQGMSI